MAVIEFAQLTKYYGRSMGVAKLDLQVAKGEIFGFLGPNGAGKSTTINMMMGIIKPSSGQVRIFGEDASGDAVGVRRRIGYVAGDMELYGYLTGRQYLNFVGRICHEDLAARAAKLAERLQANLDKRIHALSRGNRQKIALIAALARTTDLLILDEPTSGLDPLIQRQFNELVAEYQNDGGTVFISSHVLSEVQQLCGRVAFIKEGTIVAAGTLEHLMGTIHKRVSIKAPAAILQGIAKRKDIQNVRLAEGALFFEIAANGAGFLADLPLGKIKDITVAPPELEEIFMTYYQKGAG